jgi:hypothetical protein
MEKIMPKTEEKKYLGKSLTFFTKNKLWSASNKIIEGFIDTSNKFENDLSKVKNELKYNLFNLFGEHIASQKRDLNINSTMRELFDLIADVSEEDQSNAHYTNLKQFVCESVCVVALNDNIQMATQKTTSKYTAPNGEEKSVEIVQGDLIAKNNYVIEKTLNTEGQEIDNPYEYETPLSSRQMKTYFNKLNQNSRTPLNRPDTDINKIKSVIELILKRINQGDSAFSSEEEKLLLALENCIEHYIEFNQSFDAGGNASEATNKIGVEMFKTYSKHSLNPIKINRKKYTTIISDKALSEKTEPIILKNQNNKKAVNE